MAAKRKDRSAGTPSTPGSRQQLDQARQDHAKGKMCMEDFIWTAMQCYASDVRNGHKPTGRFHAA